jgi:hypothetical protein
MTIPAAARNHHTTVWVSSARRRRKPARGAVEGDRPVCSGDGGQGRIVELVQ